MVAETEISVAGASFVAAKRQSMGHPMFLCELRLMWYIFRLVAGVMISLAGQFCGILGESFLEAQLPVCPSCLSDSFVIT